MKLFMIEEWWCFFFFLLDVAAKAGTLFFYHGKKNIFSEMAIFDCVTMLNKDYRKTLNCSIWMMDLEIWWFLTLTCGKICHHIGMKNCHFRFFFPIIEKKDYLDPAWWHLLITKGTKERAQWLLAFVVLCQSTFPNYVPTTLDSGAFYVRLLDLLLFCCTSKEIRSKYSSCFK